MYRSLVVLLAVGPLVAAPGVKGKEPVLYFPVKEGATRVYRFQFGDKVSEITETVTKVEVKDGVYRVTIATEQAGSERTTAAFAMSAGGVSRLHSGGKEFDQPIPILKPPATVGTKWAWGTGGAATNYAITAEEEVEVPAGKFRCLRVEVTAGTGRMERKMTSWHAPGVGLVKTEVAGTPGSDGFVRELKSFTPGK
jgi:hypothetical protein